MNIKITATEEGQNLEVVHDGTIVVSRGTTFEIAFEELKYQFVFIEPIPDTPILKTETIKEEGSDVIKFMKFTLQLAKNDLSSLFAPPVEIGKFKRANDDNHHKLYLSFNARSLDGDPSNCIAFSYTLFIS